MSESTRPSLVGCGDVPLAPEGRSRALWRVLVISAVFMIAEVVGGIAANSLALLADAAHMLTDVAAVALALFVTRLARRPATAERPLGYLRFEILAALINGSALLVIAGSIVWEAIDRFRAPPDVNPTILFGVATAGLVANLVSMRILHANHDHSLNMRGVYLHVVSDMLGSFGAILAGIIIMTTGWSLADPIVSVVVAVLILQSAWRLVRESTDILLESVPAHIKLDDVQRRLATVPGVTEVHHLHVWTVTSGMVAMSGHVVVPDPDSHQRALEDSQRRMEEMGISHVTVQVERETTCQGTGEAGTYLREA